MEIKSATTALLQNQDVCSSFFFISLMDPELIKEWQVKINKILSTSFPSVPSAGIVSQWMLYKLSNIPKKISQSDVWHHVRLSSDPGSAKVAMIGNMGVNMGLLMSQPSISISIPQQKCPTVIKAIHYIPTQYASISIQVHSPLLTAIETGLLECDQVASTPIIHYIIEDHWSNNNNHSWIPTQSAI